MNWYTFKHDLKYWLTSPLFYFFLTSYFLFNFVMILGTGGFFDGGVYSDELKIPLNNAYSLIQNSFLLNKFFLPVIALVVSITATRDFTSKTFTYLFSYPIKKFNYLFGKFLAAFFIIIVLLIIKTLGLYIATVILGSENPYITDQHFSAYASMLFAYTIPAILTFSLIIFLSASYFRSVFAGLITAVLLVIFQYIISNILFKNPVLLGMLDPFGEYIFQWTVHEWDFAKKSGALVPFKPLLLLNRISWLVVCFTLFLIFLKSFHFQFENAFTKPSFLRKKYNVSSKKEDLQETSINHTLSFSFFGKLKIAFRISFYYLKSILKQPLSIILTFFALLAVFFLQVRIVQTGEYNLLPLTRILIGVPLTVYVLILTLNLFLSSSFLSYRSHNLNMWQMTNVCSIENWQIYIARFLALLLMLVVQFVLFILLCLVIQVTSGFYDFKLSLFAYHVFVLIFPGMICWIILSLFLNQLFSNQYLSLFAICGVLVFTQLADALPLKSFLIQYNSYPVIEYSDISKYGSQLSGFFRLMLYWLCFSGILLAFTLIFSRRELQFKIKDRIRFSLNQIKASHSIGIFLFLSIFIFSGFSIYKAEKENVSLPNRTAVQDYKDEWSKYDRIAVPTIDSIELEISIDPLNNSFVLNGRYSIKNKTGKRLDTLLLKTGFDEKTTLSLEEAARLIHANETYKSYLYKLNKPIEPGQSMALKFTVESIENSMFKRNSNVLENGSFLRHDMLPRFGYFFTEHELAIDDLTGKKKHFYHHDADKVHLSTTIHCKDEQMIIAPGELTAHIKGKEYNTYKYETTGKIKMNFAFHAFELSVHNRKLERTTINIYHAVNHHQNVKTMLDGIEAGINFNEKYFGNYPYTSVDIVEFPLREASFTATLTANVIPTSEKLFSFNPVAMQDKFNLPFYVMAHEITHEWFGNQLMPADLEGAKFLTESITEYISLLIYRNEFGEEAANRFLEIQKERYLNGKRKKRTAEKPLYKVTSDDEYVAYGKGAIALKTISDEIGEEKMLNTLSEFLLLYKDQENNYPSSLDFIELLKTRADLKHHELIDYWLMEIHPI